MKFNKLNNNLFMLSYLLFLFDLTFFCFKFYYEGVVSTELNAISLSSKSFILGYLIVPVISKRSNCTFLNGNSIFFPLILLFPYFLSQVSIFPSIPTSDILSVTTDVELLMKGIPLTDVGYGGYPAHLILNCILGLVTDMDLFEIYPIYFGLISFLIVICIFFISQYFSNTNLGSILYLATGSLFSYYYLVPATIGLLFFAMIGFCFFKLLTNQNEVNWKILLLILIPAIITVHLFSSVFAFFFILSVLIISKIFPLYKLAVRLVAIFLVFILAHHIYISYFIFSDAVSNLYNFLSGQELVAAYNIPAYLGLPNSEMLLIIKKISSLFRWIIALLAIWISFNYKKLTKKEQEFVIPLICIITCIGFGGILFRYLAPSYGLRLSQYLWIYLCLLASISAQHFKIIHGNYTFIFYFFVIIITFFGFIDHVNSPQTQVSIQEMACMEKVTQFSMNESIVVPVDEKASFYNSNPTGRSNLISIDNFSSSLSWEHAYTDFNGANYVFLPHDEKLDYYKIRFNVEIPWIKIKSFLSHQILFYNNGKSKVYLL
ncbi:hypothetical protein FTO70_05205 [Methanosarcina sp. KYL-1]|uniref:hypothetical protein n=1 Tax=Methanosarcina sp. KYL-1 TaxID=2602068 RepID=UPI00210135D9|nr:hypothetical protein [Methanosarcina sp. KYL-1]MCQ1535095.1 hypothetical protein [Methanosarcina sp. KYL-1]